MLRFSPDEHLPSPALLFASSSSVDELRARCAGTLAGRLAAHPGCWRALEGLRARLEEAARDLWTPAGARLAGVLGRILERAGGGAAVAVYRAPQPHLVHWILAADLSRGSPEETRALGEGIPEALKEEIGEAAGSEAEPRQVGDLAALAVAAAGRELLIACIGGYCLASTSSDLLADAAAACRRGSRRDSIAGGRLRAELQDHLAIGGESLRAEIDLRELQAALTAWMGDAAEEKRAQSLLRFTGLNGLSSMAVVLGFRGEEAELRIRVGLQAGTGGLLEAVQAGLLRLEDPEAFAPRVPRDALDIAAVRVAPGRMLRRLDAHLRQTAPEVGGGLDLLYRWLEESTGVSVADDLWTLDDITALRYRRTPEGGALFPDALWLARSDELAPYWNLAVKLAALLGAERTSIDAGGRALEYFDAPAGLASSLLGPLLPWNSAGADEESGSRLGTFAARWSIAAFLSLGRIEADGGWTLVSTSPMALRRAAAQLDASQSLAGDAVRLDRLREVFSGSTAAAATFGGGSALWWYNSILGAGGAAPTLLRSCGIEPVHLPPAEIFAGGRAEASIELRIDPRGIDLRCRRFPALRS